MNTYSESEAAVLLLVPMVYLKSEHKEYTAICFNITKYDDTCYEHVK